MSEVLLQCRKGIHRTITNTIMSMIEAGEGTYKVPWHAPDGFAAHLPVNAATHAEYRGVNILSLWIEAQVNRYPSAHWASYRQWQSLGAQVRKGERGAMVVFYKRMEMRATEAEDHDKKGELRFFARASHVFNAAQVDGYRQEEPELVSEFQKVQEVEAFVATLQADVRHGFNHACYRRDTDAIEMPNREWFGATGSETPERSYYAVLLHELTHWSGAAHRLNRLFGKRFGDEAYAFEELVAELGAAFLCAAFGLSSEPRPDHAAYVGHWLKILDRDSKAIFLAAAKAQEAFEHLAYLAIRPDA